MFKINGLEIFATGTWNGDKYTAQDLEAMVRSFDKVGFKPPLKMGHTDKQTFLQRDGLPAAGWIDKIYIKGNKLLADVSNIPKKVFELLQNKAYRHVSSEIYWNLKRNGEVFSRALKAVALLGAETPAVSGLTPIDQMLSQYLAAFTADAEDTKTYEFETETLILNKQADENPEHVIDDILLYAAKGIQFVIGKRIGATTTSTQTVIFSKMDWTVATAKEWLQQNNMRSDKVDETADSLRFRQVDPSQFQPGSFRTIAPGATSTTNNAGHDKKKKKKLNTNEGDNKMTVEELQVQMEAQIEQMKADREAKEKEYIERVSDLTAKLETKDSEVVEMGKSLAAIKKSRIVAESKAFTASLIGEGKLAPAIASDVETLLTTLADNTAEIKQYADDKEVTFTTVNFVKRIFEAMPKIVDFNETAESNPVSTDQNAVDALDKKITEYAEKHNVSYGEAAAPVLAANPSLANKYYN